MSNLARVAPCVLNGPGVGCWIAWYLVLWSTGSVLVVITGQQLFCLVVLIRSVVGPIPRLRPTDVLLAPATIRPDMRGEDVGTWHPVPAGAGHAPLTRPDREHHGIDDHGARV